MEFIYVNDSIDYPINPNFSLNTPTTKPINIRIGVYATETLLFIQVIIRPIVIPINIITKGYSIFGIVSFS